MVLAAIAAKGVALLLAAALATRLLRAAPASTRHGIWVAAFAALLLLPVLEAVGPRWTVGVLPGAPPVLAGAPALPSLPPLPPAPPAPPFSMGAEMGEPMAGFEHSMQAFEQEMAAFEGSMVEFESNVEAFAESQSGVSLARVSTSWPERVRGGLLALWALGVVGVLLRWLAATLAARRLVATALDETDEEWGVLAERARRLSGLEQPVRLARSGALDVPVAWGWGTPTVVLPADADDWDDDRREAVLLHEMAHLARRDAWTQAVAQLALAVHWANPLAWWSYRRFLDAREQACDDAVIRSGARPSAYAAHLVGVARSVRRERLALSALAPMARTAPLEDRVVAILDASRARDRIGRPALTGLLCLAAAVVLPIAALQPVAQTPTAPSPAVAPAPPARPAVPAAPSPPLAPQTARLAARLNALDSPLGDRLDTSTTPPSDPDDRQRQRPDRQTVAPVTPALADRVGEAGRAGEARDVADSVMENAGAIIDLDQIRSEIQATLRDLENDTRPEAAIERFALRQAADQLKNLDPEVLRIQTRAEPRARQVERQMERRAEREERRRETRPGAVDWSEIDRARRQAQNHTPSAP